MSASPAPQEQKDSSTAIKFQFCAECSNLLYPYEDKDTNTLNFKCRTCSSLEPATTACVYRNDLSEGVTETAGITQDVGSDPTVGDNLDSLCLFCGMPIFCASCGTSYGDDDSFVDDDEDGESDDLAAENSPRKKAPTPRHVHKSPSNKSPSKTGQANRSPKK